jgi:hypothetical protein
MGIDNDSDIGRITYGLRANAKDAYDIWLFQPSRRADFGERELQDIRETSLALQILLREIDKENVRRFRNAVSA